MATVLSSSVVAGGEVWAEVMFSMAMSFLVFGSPTTTWKCYSGADRRQAVYLTGRARIFCPGAPVEKFCFPPPPACGFLVPIQFNQKASMKTIVKITGLAACALAFVGTAPAQDTVTGKWQGQFDSQIGVQTYTYDFKADGTNLTGRAVGISESRTNDAAITEGKINQDEISFVEPLSFDG